MTERDRKPDIEWDESYSSATFRELFRYRKAGKERIYNLHERGEKAELWVVSEAGTRSRRLATFNHPDETMAFLEDVERELRQGNWQQV